MSENPLFRKAALDKLASPERLDVLMQVTSPMGWLALTTVAGILVGVIVWSILGSIPERITGEGVLLRGGANTEIRSSGSGTLTTLNLKINQVISVGQVLGTITAAGNNEEVNIARTKLQQLEAQRSSQNFDATAAIGSAEMQLANYQSDLNLRMNDLQRLQADLPRLEQLFKDGGITQQRVESQRQQIGQMQTQITGIRSQISAAQNQIRQLRSGGVGVEGQIRVAQAELQRVLAKVGAQESLTSTVAGRVIETRKNIGDAIQQGDVVATLESTDSSVQVIAFVSGDVGKRIKTGAETEVSPTDVKREEYGFMHAKISERGDFAASAEAVQSRMRNEAVTKRLLGQGTVVEIRADLQPASTESGFSWSTSKGPPFKISSGTIVSVAIVVQRKAPITMVMPFLKKTFGVA